MSTDSVPARYFPDRSPTWTEVVVGLLVTVEILVEVTSSEIALPAATLGFLTFALAVGPAANTGVGERVGGWFRARTVAERAVVIVLFFVVVVVTSRLEPVPGGLLSDFAVGGLGAVVCYLLAYLVWAGEISGRLLRRNNG
jgi:hypothetical protein